MSLMDALDSMSFQQGIKCKREAQAALWLNAVTRNAWLLAREYKALCFARSCLAMKDKAVSNGHLAHSAALRVHNICTLHFTPTIKIAPKRSCLRRHQSSLPWCRSTNLKLTQRQKGEKQRRRRRSTERAPRAANREVACQASSHLAS